MIFFPKDPLLAAAGALLGVALAAEWLRLRHPNLNQIFLQKLGSLLKQNEGYSLTGSTYIFASTVLVIGVMPQPIAVLALFYLAIPDPLAALVGQRMGRHWLGRKSLEGAVTCWTAAITVGVVLTSITLEVSMLVIMIGAFAATIFEFAPARLDDNLRIPVGSGVLMWLASTWA